jgi:hypothetical protein
LAPVSRPDSGLPGSRTARKTGTAQLTKENRRVSHGYTRTCIAVLALGIGANTAIFSVIHLVILTPLPYPNPSSLAVVGGSA